jgi:hypothetical protein
MLRVHFSQPKVGRKKPTVGVKNERAEKKHN